MSYKGNNLHKSNDFTRMFISNDISPKNEDYSFSGQEESVFLNERRDIIDNLSIGIEKVSWIIGKIDKIEKR